MMRSTRLQAIGQAALAGCAILLAQQAWSQAGCPAEPLCGPLTAQCTQWNGVIVTVQCGTGACNPIQGQQRVCSGCNVVNNQTPPQVVGCSCHCVPCFVCLDP